MDTIYSCVPVSAIDAIIMYIYGYAQVTIVVTAVSFQVDMMA